MGQHRVSSTYTMKVSFTEMSKGFVSHRFMLGAALMLSSKISLSRTVHLLAPVSRTLLARRCTLANLYRLIYN